jgi:cytoskeleton protein RodZ
MGLSELGAYLRRHREERGWTLDEVEALTRIRRQYLEAIEAGDWDNLPPSVFTRGLVRSYARALGVSQASVMRMYVKDRPQEARLPEPQLISQPLVNAPRFNFELIVAAGLLIVSVVLIAWAVRSALPGGGQAVVAGTAAPTGSVTAPAVASGRGGATGTPTVRAGSRGAPSATPLPTLEGRRTAVRLADTPAATGTGTPPTAAVGASASVTPGALTPSAPARTPSRTPTAPTSPTAPGRGTAAPTARVTPAATAPLVLEVVVTSDAWLEVRADGEVVFRDFLRQGDARRWSARERVGLRTGNAGGTDVKLNGQAPPAGLGERGAVKEFEWRLLPNGEIEQREL